MRRWSRYPSKLSAVLCSVPRVLTFHGYSVQIARYYHSIRDHLINSTKTQQDLKPLRDKRKVARSERKTVRVRRRLKDSGEFAYVISTVSSVG